MNSMKQRNEVITQMMTKRKIHHEGHEAHEEEKEN